MAINLTVNLLRGNHSPLGLERCGVADWSIFGLFIFLMIVLSCVGLVINKREQALKIKAKKGMVASDIRFSGS